MALWIEPGGVTEFEHEGVIFRIRHLTAREQGRIADMGTEIASPEIFETLRLGLAGWSGEGSPAFTVGGDGLVTSECLDRLSASAWGPLVQEIIRVNHLSDTDRGNSNPSSPPASAT